LSSVLWNHRSVGLWADALGGVDTGCYAGVLGGSIAALTGAVNCNTVLSDRKVASDVYLSGVLRNHRSVGFRWQHRLYRATEQVGFNYITVGAGSAPSNRYK
jgi:hypothetical protein